MTKRSREGRADLLADIVIIALSVYGAVLLARSGWLHEAILSLHGFEYLGAFFAGALFTSIFTTAPAIVVLGEMANTHGVLPVALVGAAGSVAGDYILFRIVRGRMSGRLAALTRRAGVAARFGALMRFRLFRVMSFLIGGLVIASPLPDEIGVGLLGISRLSTLQFLAISYTFNAIGIALIGLAAASLVN